MPKLYDEQRGDEPFLVLDYRDSIKADDRIPSPGFGKALLANIIMKAIRADPNERYQTPCDMIEDLRKLPD